MSLAATRTKHKHKPSWKCVEAPPAPRKVKLGARRTRPAQRHDARKMLRVIARLDTQEDGSENSCRVSINTGRKEITDVTFDRDDLPDIEELHGQLQLALGRG